MIHPAIRSKAKQRPEIVVACLSSRIGDPVATHGIWGSGSFANRDQFLAWCMRQRGGLQVWLTPHSADWGGCIPALVENGCGVRPSKRRGEYANLSVTMGDRTWLGRSSSGFIDIPHGLTPVDEASATWQAMCEIQDDLSEAWPGVSLGTSLAATAVSCFRQHLTSPIGCEWSISRELRQMAYGGGRVELFCRPGSEYASSAGRPLLWDLDISGAYATAMIEKPIPGEFDSFGSEIDVTMRDCTISAAVVNVPYMPFPPLRVEHAGQVYYPWGVLFGCWTTEELRAATTLGCTIQEVLSVMRFRPREEFESFGRAVKGFRVSAASPHSRTLGKGLAVQLAGALGSKPSLQRFTCTPSGRYGFKIDRCGVYTESTFRPSDREVLSAACTITGIPRAWLALTLSELWREVGIPTHVHTDGTIVYGIDRAAIERALRGAAIKGGIDPIHWKITPLQKLEIWAANQRISMDSNGVEKTAAGGISRELSPAEIRNQLRSAKLHVEETAWMSGRRKADPRGSYTAPLSFAEVDPKRAEELRRIYKLSTSIGE